MGPIEAGPKPDRAGDKPDHAGGKPANVGSALEERDEKPDHVELPDRVESKPADVSGKSDRAEGAAGRAKGKPDRAGGESIDRRAGPIDRERPAEASSLPKNGGLPGERAAVAAPSAGLDEAAHVENPRGPSNDVPATEPLESAARGATNAPETDRGSLRAPESVGESGEPIGAVAGESLGDATDVRDLTDDPSPSTRTETPPQNPAEDDDSFVGISPSIRSIDGTARGESSALDDPAVRDAPSAIDGSATHVESAPTPPNSARGLESEPITEPVIGGAPSASPSTAAPSAGVRDGSEAHDGSGVLDGTAVRTPSIESTTDRPVDETTGPIDGTTGPNDRTAGPIDRGLDPTVDTPSTSGTSTTTTAPVLRPSPDGSDPVTTAASGADRSIEGSVAEPESVTAAATDSDAGLGAATAGSPGLDRRSSSPIAASDTGGSDASITTTAPAPEPGVMSGTLGSSSDSGTSSSTPGETALTAETPTSNAGSERPNAVQSSDVVLSDSARFSDDESAAFNGRGTDAVEPAFTPPEGAIDRVGGPPSEPDGTRPVGSGGEPPSAFDGSFGSGLPTPDGKTAGIVALVTLSGVAVGRSLTSTSPVVVATPSSSVWLLLQSLWFQIQTTVAAARRCFQTLPWSALGIGYSRYDDTDPLENETRATLHDSIRSMPGVNLAELSRDADVSRSTARYHLRVLEYERLVASSKVRGKRRLYPVVTDEDERILAAALRDESTATVLEALAEREPATGSELADALDRDPSTITHHLSRLAEEELVERERDGRAVVNRLSGETRAMLARRVAEAEASHPATNPAD
ncbi:ArsR family transcriptional regulator [Halosolutus gelatinilyticus]|uniref:ArsR family transcriptional regulator n=1 Tax=Halosolutus gelatinilyticus TaxID=2931975 RepID=UPI001FF1DA94|nr:ArsR family transcriptional regulator [Halosolutus gelatinilyticus]